MGRQNLSQYDEERMLFRIDRLAARVEDLQAELERAHRLVTLGTMTGVIVHEMNNILTPIMSYAQLALQARHDAELVERALIKAVEGTERAAEVAGSVLGFIRGDASKPTANIALIVKEAISCITREPEKDGIEVRTDLPSLLEARIPEIALQQVLLNLILNARQAIAPESGIIAISAECSTWNTEDIRVLERAREESGPEMPQDVPDELSLVGLLGGLDDLEPMGEVDDFTPRLGAPVVRIKIADTGRGMDAELLSRIFSPYVTERSDGSQGTGLGLSICRRLVTKAGGTIGATSQVGQGSTFTVTLPLVAVK